jgi:hypothetical protein
MTTSCGGTVKTHYGRLLMNLSSEMSLSRGDGLPNRPRRARPGPPVEHEATVSPAPDLHQHRT